MPRRGQVRRQPAERGLGGQVRSGLTWSFVNTLASRLGSFLTGIIVARLVVPEDFGVYAVALVALNVLLSMNELGVSVALVRHPGSVAGIAPTVTTIAIGSSAVLFAASWFLAAPFAQAMGVPEAAGVVQLMSVAVLIDGIASVSVGLLTRAFMQAKRTQIDLIAFAVSTPVTIILAITGFGAWSLAWGAIVGNLVTGALSLLWAPELYWPGFDRKVAGELLRFSLPLAAASLLLLALVNVDFVVVGRMLGTAELGLYLLAFNLSTWPMTLVSSVVRRVTTPLFAQMHQRGDGESGFRRAVFLVMAPAVLLCTLLAVYSNGIVLFVYGEKWQAAAVAVPALALLSLGRMIVELAYDYLVAVGRTVGNTWLHGIWLVLLVPALVVGAAIDGIRGVSIAHAAVVVCVVVPGVALLLHSSGLRLRVVFGDLYLAVFGAAAVIASAWAVSAVVPEGFLRLALGGLIGTAIYAAILAKRFRRTLSEVRVQPAPKTEASQLAI